MFGGWVVNAAAGSLDLGLKEPGKLVVVGTVGACCSGRPSLGGS